MTTKLWIGSKLYMVDESVADEIAGLTAKLSNSIDMVGHEKAVDGLIAHIERLRGAVIGKIDRMQDIAPECGDSAERIIGDFLEVIIPIIENETPKQSLVIIQADAIEEMLNYFKDDLTERFADKQLSLSVDVMIEYAEQLRNK